MPTLIRKITITIFIIFFVWIDIFCKTYAGDLLDTAFQPSKNLQHVINIWNTKDAVGNTIFGGSTNIDDVKLDFVPGCYLKISLNNQGGEITQQQCLAKNNFRQVKTPIKEYWFGCYSPIPKTDINGKKLEQGDCQSPNEWTMLVGVSTSQNPSLLVRITKTLLRLTIILSIPMIIFIGVKVMIGIISWETDYKEKFKSIGLVIWWLILALSAIGIIYLIQSITMNSLPLIAQ